MLNPFIILFLGLLFLYVSLAPFFLIASAINLSKQKRVCWFFGGIAACGVLNWLIVYEGYRLVQLNAMGGVVVNLLFPLISPWVIYLFFRYTNKP